MIAASLFFPSVSLDAEKHPLARGGVRLRSWIIWRQLSKASSCSATLLLCIAVGEDPVLCRSSKPAPAQAVRSSAAAVCGTVLVTQPSPEPGQSLGVRLG